MADRNYDLLNQVQYWVQDPRSPILKEMREKLAPLEQRAAAIDEKSPEFAKINAEYQKQAAAFLLSRMQKEFGGSFPDRKTAEDFDFAQRSGGDKEAEKLLRAESQAPYSTAFNVLEQLQQVAGVKPTAPVATVTPASLSEPGIPTKLAKPAATPKRLPAKPDASDDEKLSETQLALLHGIAQQIGGWQNAPQTLDENDDPTLRDRVPYVPREAPDRTDLPPEQKLMENYKQAFEQHEMNTAPGQQGPTYSQMPLPPGWARSPSGVPITAPGEDVAHGRSKESVDEQIRANMMRMLRQDAE